ncbi:unnamed protein product [Brassica napus]|uniref:(rape) hypothetical protein n=1 Tax=Brassica napus TaxID=3708 RepID=A0A816JX00_BRANA|nr:unnamed protein product [Brassica napus]
MAMEWEENLFIVRPLLMRTLNSSILVKLRPSSSVLCTLCNGSTSWCTESAASSNTSLAACNVREGSDGNGCGVQKWKPWGIRVELLRVKLGLSTVVSFLCNSTRGAFSISSSIDHVSFSA